MTSFALGAFIIFVIYVMIWSIRNDGAASIGEQTGFIRMRDPSRHARKSRPHPAAPRTPSDAARRR